MSHLTVNLVTPTAELLRGQVAQVTAPSVLGEVGILPDHLPLLATLVEGPVGLHGSAGVEYYAVSGGVLEVDDNTVTLLADTAERGADIDVARSKAALKRATEAIGRLDATSPDYVRSVHRAKRAEVRLLVAELTQR
jgi:F-type H+-transporting ATPase subunit epsilon